MAPRRTEVVLAETAVADIAAIVHATPRFQRDGPTYRKLMHVLAGVEALSRRAHMYPVDAANPKFRKCSVAGYVILFSWQDDGGPRGPLATVRRVIPSEWQRGDEG